MFCKLTENKSNSQRRNNTTEITKNWKQMGPAKCGYWLHHGNQLSILATRWMLTMWKILVLRHYKVGGEGGAAGEEGQLELRHKR